MNDLIAALLDTGYPFAHFFWAHAPSGTYGVYSESDTDFFSVDNINGESLTKGTVDLFTMDDSSTPKAAVEAAFDSLGDHCKYRLTALIIEQDSGYIHYEWGFTLI